MEKGSLEGLALDRIRDLLEEMDREIINEVVDKKEPLKADTHLYNISVAVTDSQRWIEALLSSLQ